MAKLRVRIDLEPAGAIGPGKVRLLESVEALGSISAAARSMRMSYRRAWLLIDSMNRSFREPVVEARPGGKSGGGAALTPFGADLVRHYREIEAAAQVRFSEQLERLQRAAVAPAEDGPVTARPARPSAAGDRSERHGRGRGCAGPGRRS